MTYHDWSDENVDWNAINEAAALIQNISRKYGRLGGYAKEKYGTVRFYASFGYLSLHTLFYPGYVYNQFPKWLWNLDCNYFGPILNKLFGKIFIRWQIKVYNYAYKKAVDKYPHIKKEILAAASYPEFITFSSKGHLNENS